MEGLKFITEPNQKCQQLHSIASKSNGDINALFEDWLWQPFVVYHNCWRR